MGVDQEAMECFEKALELDHNFEQAKKAKEDILASKSYLIYCLPRLLSRKINYMKQVRNGFSNVGNLRKEFTAQNSS